MPKFGNGHGQGNVSKLKDKPLQKLLERIFSTHGVIFFIEIAVKNQIWVLSFPKNNLTIRQINLIIQIIKKLFNN